MSLAFFSRQPSQIWPHCTFLLLMLIAHATLAGRAMASQLQAGPMVGATAMRQVKIWVQATGKGHAQIEYWETGIAKMTPVRLRTATVPLVEDTDFVAQFTVGLLEPGRTYGYRVMINGKEQKVSQTLTFKTQALWQWRTDPPDWKMALGSCAFVNETRYDRLGRPYGGAPEDKRIYASMAREAPDLTVWGGDYLYYREVDEDSELGLRYRWRYDRSTTEQQVLLRTGSHVSIWDDHEYGPNNGNSSYRLKGEALALFKRYWANPSYGLPELPGTFTTYRFNDAELFMLDNRYYRDDDELQLKDKTKLGAAQLRWLKNALLMSVSPIKLIVAGSQVTNDASKYDGWHNFPEERADILRFLVDHKVNGVIFLTGDRHFTELLKTERSGTYPLYELTCSPLLSGIASVVERERGYKKVVEGTFVAQRNFCTLDFSGSKSERKITLRSFSNTGEKLWEHELRVSELQTPAAGKP